MKREPSLRRMAVASVGLHLAVLLAFGLTTFFKSRRYTAPNPYFVSLTAPTPKKRSRPAPHRRPTTQKKKVRKNPPARTKRAAPKKKALAPALKPARRTPEPVPTEPPEEKAEQRIEDEIARLRRIKELEASRPVESDGVSGQGAAADVSARYHGLIRLKVQERWTYPGSAPKDREAEVLIVIGPHGGVLEQRIVRGSGNRDFDRSVLRAIAKASPFPAPPEGVDREIQFRFRPEGSIE